MKRYALIVISVNILFLLHMISSSHALPRIAERTIDQDSVDSKRSGILFLPIFFYTPETKIAGGAAVNYYFRESGSEKNSRPSTLMPIFIYTQKKQIIGEINGDCNSSPHLLYLY